MTRTVAAALLVLGAGILLLDHLVGDLAARIHAIETRQLEDTP